MAELIRKHSLEGSVSQWLQPYESEYNSVFRNRCEDISDELAAKIRRLKLAVNMRMLLSRKRNGRLKGRMVAQGFMEPYSWDTTSSYSPVACLASIRTLLFMSGAPDDVISSVDVSTAFLQADEFGPDEPDRYVAYAPYKGATPIIKRLKGPVYGQRTAGTRWHETVATWLTSNGFIAGENEPCVFLRDGLVVVL